MVANPKPLPRRMTSVATKADLQATVDSLRATMATRNDLEELKETVGRTREDFLKAQAQTREDLLTAQAETREDLLKAQAETREDFLKAQAQTREDFLRALTETRKDLQKEWITSRRWAIGILVAVIVPLVVTVVQWSLDLLAR